MAGPSPPTTTRPVRTSSSWVRRPTTATTTTPRTTRSITATIDTNQSLTTWENYLAKQLPVIFQPDEAYALTEYNKDLTGVTPQNPFTGIEPENWRWK